MQKMKPQKKKSSNLIFVLVILILSICIIAFIRENSPAIFGYRILNVVSGSMEPEIRTGSYILIKETDAKKLKVGDVITFVSKEPAIYGKYNTHRIYDIYQDAYTGEKVFVTKGDAHKVPDVYPVYEEEIVGKLVKVVSF